MKLILNKALDCWHENFLIIPDGPRRISTDFQNTKVALKSCSTSSKRCAQYSYSTTVIKIFPVLQHAHLPKVALLHKYFSKNLTSDVEQLFLQNTSRWLLPRSANFRKQSRMAASQRQQQRFLQCKNSHGSAYLTFLCGLSLKRFNYSDDDDDNELHLWNDWATKDVKLYLLPEPLSHNRKPPTRRKQVLNLRRTWVQTLPNEMISVTMSIHHSATSYLHRDVISRISYWFF